MALTRVQATPSPYTGNATAPTRTFTTPPTVGNAVMVAVMSLTRMTTGVTDNRSNAYTLATSWTNTGALNIAVYYCAALTGTGAPFTITTTFATSTIHLILAIEVSGVGTGIAVDRSTGLTTNSGTAPATGTTAALTGTEDVLLALHCTQTAQSSITVQSVSPPWTQEAENLTGTTAVCGEVDSRILTGAAGTTQNCSWTTTTNTTYIGVLVAFRTATAAGAARADTFLWGPI